MKLREHMLRVRLNKGDLKLRSKLSIIQQKSTVKLILCLVVNIVLLFSAVACGGISNTRTISAADQISGESYIFDTKIKKTDVLFQGTFSLFSTEFDTLNLYRELIENTPSWEFEIFQDKYILAVNKERGATPFLIYELSELSKDNKRRFAFFPAIFYADTDDADMLLKKESYMIYMPYHLMTGVKPQRYPSLYNKTFPLICETLYTIDVFVEFFQNCGTEIINKTDTSFKIKCPKTSAFIIVEFSGDTATWNVA